MHHTDTRRTGTGCCTPPGLGRGLGPAPETRCNQQRASEGRKARTDGVVTQSNTNSDLTATQRAPETRTDDKNRVVQHGYARNWRGRPGQFWRQGGCRTTVPRCGVVTSWSCTDYRYGIRYNLHYTHADVPNVPSDRDKTSARRESRVLRRAGS